MQEVTHYCWRCESAKTREDLRQVDVDEVCTYACRTCGAQSPDLEVLRWTPAERREQDHSI